MTTISINKPQHRYDSTTKPVITIGAQGTYPKLFVRDYLYEEMPTSSYLWSPPNRTDYPLEVEVRDMFLSTWTLSSGVGNSANNFTKTASEGYSGAYATAIGSGNCSIEGKPGYIYGNTVFALQSGVFTFDYYAGDVEHALVFNQDGIGFIRERGAQKIWFTWEIGDTGLVELYGGIVFYYLIKEDGTKILLRSKRSLLSYPITPTIVLYQVGAVANSVRIWNASGAATSTELYGILDDFQDWQNPASWESLADKTMNKDKTEDFTYFSELKNLMTQSISISWDDAEKYQAFLEFFKWHDISREFIFKDNARHIEYFAKFVSAFKDNPLGGEIFGMSADIRQMINPPVINPRA
jgi:hypothetical protein